ncbi:MAG: KEOPS complex subunit Cgi121 [Candidatus Bathyarchaeota archaeon]|nr:KEOPS complex subunit Cgi121 [Candidatus Bathyarchaeota archaeon]
MLKHIAEYNKFVELTGFRGVKTADSKALLEAVRSQTPKGVEVQLFDADLIASWQHLYFATVNALMAQKNQRNISKTAAVETILYASAQRQISKAIEHIGVKPQTHNVAAIVLGDNKSAVEKAVLALSQYFGVAADEKVLELSEEKTQKIRAAFDVTDSELLVSSAKDAGQALVDLIVERVALLSTQL